MPYSIDQGKDWIKKTYANVLSQSGTLRVLDVGVGSGTYSRLLRPVQPNAQWTGIEIWPPYVERFALPTLYDQVLVADARIAVRALSNEATRDDLFDVAIAGDVLEHMPVMDAVDLVENLKRITRYLFVSVPIVHWEQGAAEGNPYEAHVHHYTADEMQSLMTGVGSYNFLWQELYSDVGVWLWAAADTASTTPHRLCPTCDGGGCPDCTD